MNSIQSICFQIFSVTVIRFIKMYTYLRLNYSVICKGSPTQMPYTSQDDILLNCGKWSPSHTCGIPRSMVYRFGISVYWARSLDRTVGSMDLSFKKEFYFCQSLLTKKEMNLCKYLTWTNFVNLFFFIE